ncbi:hypothetical protein [Streptomyces sp. RerS4]|uniref:hypothetical protein n=1 Tax=Streptomyces sp. RerS4 TaxID=2942449 RepID=UPI00201BE425|nr:hypothetical protein [Streptomyces sp. RerS4]UQX04731.1 hypothetical protein M4D82_32655 [Streptomyces sp. RerS4]
MTVDIHSGHPRLIELLVDGTEIGHVPLHGNRTQLVTGELPTDPPLPVIVRIAPGPGTPRCTAVIGSAETLMSPRAF